MRIVLAVAYLYVCVIAASEDAPFATDKPITSPSGTFSIQQHYDGNWTTTIRFAGGAHPDLTLTDDYPWPGLFYISPDDHWILQIQKSGSGENIAFLSRVDSEGRFRHTEPEFMELAWAFIERVQSLHRADLYHTGIDFRWWDLGSHLLHFTFRGTYMNRDKGLEISLSYDFQKRVIKHDTNISNHP